MRLVCYWVPSTVPPSSFRKGLLIRGVWWHASRCFEETNIELLTKACRLCHSRLNRQHPIPIVKLLVTLKLREVVSSPKVLPRKISAMIDVSRKSKW